IESALPPQGEGAPGETPRGRELEFAAHEKRVQASKSSGCWHL
ncbi:MAG: hypothetical protein RL001_2041, partial [Pseudomonadota bacterium]